MKTADTSTNRLKIETKLNFLNIIKNAVNPVFDSETETPKNEIFIVTNGNTK